MMLSMFDHCSTSKTLNLFFLLSIERSRSKNRVQKDIKALKLDYKQGQIVILCYLLPLSYENPHVSFLDF